MASLTHDIKLITTTALPLMAAFIAQKGMQLLDTMMMGWLGPYALAAAALSTAIFMLVIVFCMGTLSSVGIYIARARGANHHTDIQSSVQHGLSMACLLSIPGMLLIWFSPLLLTALHQNPEVIANSAQLLHTLVWGFPGFLFFLVLREFISAFALARIVMLVSFGSIPLTFVVNYILMYGKYGFPALGIAGIGLSGAIIMWMMFFGLLVYSKYHPVLKNHVPTLRSFHFDLRKIMSMIALGISSGLIFVLDVGMFTSATMMMGYFGVEALAAHQIALQYVTVAYAAPFALSMATALQVSYAAGANDHPQAKRFAYIGISSGFIISALIGLIFIFFPDRLVSLFFGKGEIYPITISQFAISFLAIAALCQCSDAIQAITAGALRGLKDTFIPMVLCIGCYWVLGVGGAYYLAFSTTVGAQGIWYGLTIGICSASVVLLMRFFLRSA